MSDILLDGAARVKIKCGHNCQRVTHSSSRVSAF